MESAGYRHRRSPSSDRFLGLFTFSPPSSTTAVGGSTSSAGGELIEAEVFWTNDFLSEPKTQVHGGSAVSGAFPGQNLHRSCFSVTEKSGILAVLPEPDRGSQVLCRKTSISPSSSVTMSIPAIPRPPTATQSSMQEREYSQSVPAGKIHYQSAPMNVPVLAKRRNFDVFEEDDDEEEDDKVLPPHEIVARGSGVSPKTTFSVLEGVGRTLKGRDLRQVRNAIWRKTGFLD